MRDDTRPPRDGKDPSPVRALRLVHPAPPKPPEAPRTRGGRRRPFDSDLFTPEEDARLRAALKNARGLFGSGPCLADAMRVPYETVKVALKGRARVSGALAICLARALGVPLESLYRAPTDARRCAMCGRSGAP